MSINFAFIDQSPTFSLDCPVLSAHVCHRQLFCIHPEPTLVVSKPWHLLFHSLRIADLNENMQKLSKIIQSMEKKELMSIEELNINVGTINEINLKLKEYLEEIEVTFIQVPCVGVKTLLLMLYMLNCIKDSMFWGALIYLRTSTMSRVCWKRGKPVFQWSKLWWLTRCHMNNSGPQYWTFTTCQKCGCEVEHIFVYVLSFSLCDKVFKAPTVLTPPPSFDPQVLSKIWMPRPSPMI